MATLQEILDEQARIKAELQRMEEDESVTEEDSGDLRDTLVERFEYLDGKAKPLIARMEKVRNITRAAQDEANLERPSGNGFGSPDLVVRAKRDPFAPEALDAVRANVVRSSELRERALDAIEVVAKRGMATHDYAEEATRKIQGGGYLPGNNIARHILERGSPEYYDAFQEYVRNPENMTEATRAALNLGVASGGFVMVAAA